MLVATCTLTMSAALESVAPSQGSALASVTFPEQASCSHETSETSRSSCSAVVHAVSPAAPWRVVNIGNSTQVKLTAFIDALETALDRRAVRNLMPIQPGEVEATWAEAGLLRALTGYAPATGIDDGVAAFVAWYRDFYQV